jgi:Tfp pilus assembly protein PilO
MKPAYKKYITAVALVWIGCFVLFLFFYAIVMAPQKSHKNQLDKQLAEKKQIHESAMKAAQEETKIQIKEQMKEYHNRSNDFVAEQGDLANLSFDISQLSKENRLASFSIKTADIQEIAGCNFIAQNQILISFTAGFNQFAAFLNALERHRPVVFVDKFTITRSEQDVSASQVSMELSVFVRK